MTTTYVAIHVITTMDACGYITRRLAADRIEAREVIQQLEATNIYKSIRYSKEILTGKKLAAWNAYLAEKKN